MRTALVLWLCCSPCFAQEDSSRITDEVIAPRIDLVPARPQPLIEFGDPFLSPGELGRPLVAPTGAVVQPRFMVFGNFRSALASSTDGNVRTTEWTSRLDLFGNLQLTGTERLLVGVRPLDKNGSFTRYTFRPSGKDDGWEDELNARVTTLFFEGDVGEIFPTLDRRDERTLDLGFSIGRQPLSFQNGMLLNDTIDAIGVTRNNILPSGGSNVRVTGLVGWNDVNRANNVEARDSLLVGVFSEADYPKSTFSFDAVYVADDDSESTDDSDAFFVGAGAVQRFGHYNTSFRALVSHPVHENTAAARRGSLFFGEVSRNLVHSDDQVYFNAFWGIDEFSSAARGPDAGGPLGQTGILFSAVGLGRYGAALGNDADNSVGGAVGWQTFMGDVLGRKQIVLEVGGRTDTDGTDEKSIASGFRYSQAFGSHTILRFDGFMAGRNDLDPALGLRVELQLKF